MEFKYESRISGIIHWKNPTRQHQSLALIKQSLNPHCSFILEYYSWISGRGVFLIEYCIYSLNGSWRNRKNKAITLVLLENMAFYHLYYCSLDASLSCLEERKSRNIPHPSLSQPPPSAPTSIIFEKYLNYKFGELL